MPILSFTRDEVEAAADARPWKRQVAFREEISPDDMADTAAIYARAAGEAGDAGDLARGATELGGDSGSLDGESLVDEEGRIDATSRGLQGNGADMDAVVGYVVRAMNRALDADEEVHDVIHGERGLEAKYVEHLNAAITEWNGWQAALEAALQPDLGLVLFGPPFPISVEYGGERAIASPRMLGLGNYEFEFPLGFDARIRTKYLRRAAEDATTADGEITDALDAYRGKLAEFGQELGDLGYDLSDGPLGLWTSEGMAVYAADHLADEMRKDHPDPEELLRWTETLDAIGIGIHTADNPDTPLRDMTPAERAYLDAFYGRLDKEELSLLGGLARGAEGMDPDVAGNRFTAAQRVADGLLMLTNPEIGGIDPSNAAGRAALPAGLRDHLYGDRQAFIDGFVDVSIPNRGGPDDAYWDALRDFNGFGQLMGAASVAPGDRLATDMAHAAVNVQGLTQYHYFDGGYGDTANTGSDGLLRAVALNSGTSAELLNDRTFRESALGIHWEDSTGVGDLVRSGTTVPDGVDHNDPEAEAYTHAAFNVLEYAAGHNEEILGTKNHNISEYGPINHSALQDAVGDTALQYMDMISKGGTASGFASSATDFTDVNLHGKDYRYSFDLSDSDRESLFTLMNHADGDVRENFFNGVGQWQEMSAHDAFRRDMDAQGQQDGERRGESSVFDHIGRIAGTVQHVQEVAPVNDTSKNQFTGYGAISTAASVVNTIGDFGKGNLVAQLGAFGLTEALRYTLPDGAAAVDAAQWEAVNWGDTSARATIAYAAQRAEYGNAEDYRIPVPSEGGFNQTDVIESVRNIEGDAYQHYAQAMINAYNRAAEPRD
ncbi:hypothetical protein [Streptomyces avicenniae]|uniref:hypothetical protein n=1 Tax=Streptomyces avicenniae TaxID=500153 RepID=UPI000699D179|nr:hypothetical protein [Streptomyces avicenniae]